MADLISSLADAIVALINAKPQSPTKAEVEAVIREHALVSIPAGRMLMVYGGDGELCPPEPLKVKWSNDLMEAVRSATAPYAWTPCPGSTDGSHAWTYHVNADECRCPCGARAEGYKP